MKRNQVTVLVVLAGFGVAGPCADVAAATLQSAAATTPVPIPATVPAASVGAARLDTDSPRLPRRGGPASRMPGGRTWTAVIYGMAQAVGEKRGAQAALVFDDLLPQGYMRESLAGRKAARLDPARLAQLRKFVVDSMRQLGEPDTTRQVRVKHLICACTGLPRQDYEWLPECEGQTPAQSLETLATMQPTSAFGEVFHHSNSRAAGPDPLIVRTGRLFWRPVKHPRGPTHS